MKRSIASRITITRQGKVLRRPMGVNHFRTRKSTKLLRKKNKKTELKISKKTANNY